MPYIILLCCLLGSIGLQGQQQDSLFNHMLEQHADAFAYSYGAVLGAELKTIGLDCDKQSIASIVKGIESYAPLQQSEAFQKSAQTLINTTIQSLRQKDSKAAQKGLRENQNLAAFYEAYGAVVAHNWNQFGVSVESVLIADFQAGLSMANQQNNPFNPQLGQRYITQHDKALKEQQLAQKQADNDRFFEGLKSQKNLTFSKEGFAYQILEKGAGRLCQSTDKISLRYTGTLLDGRVFDKSPADGQAILVDYKGVMPGWQALFALINKGTKVKVYFQPHLGYSSRKMPNVPANSILVYEFEIVDIQ